jgi:hypothetical protein
LKEKKRSQKKIIKRKDRSQKKVKKNMIKI